MPLKNTYTTQSVNRMLEEIQKALIRVRATGINYKFDTNGKIVGLAFGLMVKGTQVGFILPINIEKVKTVLVREGNKRAIEDSEYVYRVAWACMRDWVVAQLALIETEMAEPLQVFLPYAQDRGGETLYEKVISSNLLLN